MYERLWAYSWQHIVDHQHRRLVPHPDAGQPRHQDEKSPAGKTDYHTMGACYDVLRALGA